MLSDVNNLCNHVHVITESNHTYSPVFGTCYNCVCDKKETNRTHSPVYGTCYNCVCDKKETNHTHSPVYGTCYNCVCHEIMILNIKQFGLTK